MALSDVEFSRQLLTKLCEAAVVHGKPAVQSASSQLAESLTFTLFNDEHAAMYLPHYWAVYVHDGRASFGVRGGSGRPVAGGRRRAKVLVWFRNPADDPRLNSGRAPERYTDTRQLSEAQYKFFLKKNEQVKAAFRKIGITDERLMPLPMIVSQFASGSPGKFFFSNQQGMSGFSATAGEVARQQFSEHVKDVLGDLLNARVTTTINVA